MATQLQEPDLRWSGTEGIGHDTAIPHSYLLSISDDTGVFQHAKGKIPWRDHGYCSDDVARALVFAIRNGYPERLACTCMSFLLDASVPGVGFRNFMSFDRRWLEDVGSADCQGRVIWALGLASRTDPFGSLALPANYLLKEVAAHVSLWSEHPRAWAYALVGLSGVTEESTQRLREQLADRLLDLYRHNAKPEWPWFEDHLSYANALLAHAAILQPHRPGGVELGIAALDWLFELQCEGDILSFCGNSRKAAPGDKPTFDQQAIEAQEMSDACVAAYRATGDRDWIVRQRLCLDWFHGRNILNAQLGDPLTGACADGLGQNGPSLNHGAESTLAYLLTQADALDLR